MSLILFLIYIGGVFNSVSKTSPGIIFLSFIDNLGFITSGYLMKKIIEALEKVAQTVIELRNFNAVIYNIAKTKAAIFFKSYCQ